MFTIFDYEALSFGGQRTCSERRRFLQAVVRAVGAPSFVGTQPGCLGRGIQAVLDDGLVEPGKTVVAKISVLGREWIAEGDLR